MKFAISTNWCNQTLSSGEEIADRCRALGFDALELGFNTTPEQVDGFRRRLDVMPVGSVHAFCPVPISAPQGYPELYLLADPDAEARAMARLQISRNVAFAAEMGADTVVLHAGRVLCAGWFARWDVRRRVRRGRKRLDVLRGELARLLPCLEKNRVVLALENLPYREGFPAEWEIGEVCGEWVRPWLDTGHDYVRRTAGWGLPSGTPPQPWGLHLSDSVGGDDHLPPGEGKVDFAALRETARKAHHLVFEPNARVSDARLSQSLVKMRELWKDDIP